MREGFPKAWHQKYLCQAFLFYNRCEKVRMLANVRNILVIRCHSHHSLKVGGAL